MSCFHCTKGKKYSPYGSVLGLFCSEGKEATWGIKPEKQCWVDRNVAGKTF